MLADFSWLTELRLDGNQISDISALASLFNLMQLRLQSNPLGWEAYCTCIPIIQTNNSGV